MNKISMWLDFATTASLAVSVLILNYHNNKIQKSYDSQLEALRLKANQRDMMIDELIKEYQTLRIKVSGFPIISPPKGEMLLREEREN